MDSEDLKNELCFYYQEALTYSEGPDYDPGVAYYRGLRDGLYFALLRLGRLDLIEEEYPGESGRGREADHPGA